jgi:hypothetical protein
MTKRRPLCLAVALGLVVVACSGGNDAGDQPPLSTTGVITLEPSSTAEAPVQQTVAAYDGTFGEGWENYGWTATIPDAPGPASLDLSGYGGWILASPGLTGTYSALTIRLAADPGLPQGFLKVGVGNGVDSGFPEVEPQFIADGTGLVATIPMSELLGGYLNFDRIVMAATTGFDPGTVILVESVLLTVGDPQEGVEIGLAQASATVDCTAPGTEISPHIYGINYAAINDVDGQWGTGATTRRWGGNPTSRYNWRIGAWNTALDYYWRNVSIGNDTQLGHQEYLTGNWEHGATSAMTIPMIGYVSKDDESYAFPVSEFGEQDSTDPDIPDAGNGYTPDEQPIPPGDPSRTSVRSTPADATEWIRSMLDEAEAAGQPAPFMYFLDNEPDLWNTTHRDVHPEPSTYDEIRDLGIAYGEAIKAADPTALVAGPTSWGWPGYFYSALDAEDGFGDTPDHDAHGGTDFLAWYLQEMAAYEARTGTRLLDVLDVHFYPQNGVYLGDGSPELRMRSTRALWDPTYLDESWIEDEVQLLPRLQGWVDEHYPGTRISIGEYSFGGEGHISGGAAQVEALGRFGQFGVFAAYYWTHPPENSPTWWAFRAFTDYDGQGSAFGDLSLPTTADEPLSVFASRRGDDAVLVVVNRTGEAAVDATIDVSGCEQSAITSYSFEGGVLGPGAATRAGDEVAVRLLPYSYSVIELSS